MGLYAEIQKDIKAAFESDLSDAYKDISVTKTYNEVYDPITGVMTESSTTESFKGAILKNITGDNLDNAEVSITLQILVLDSDKPFDFEEDQKITYSGKDHKISGIETDPVNATWTVTCIAWN